MLLSLMVLALRLLVDEVDCEDDLRSALDEGATIVMGCATGATGVGTPLIEPEIVDSFKLVDEEADDCAEAIDRVDGS